MVGELTGTTTPEKIYIIGGHYDHLEGESSSDNDSFLKDVYPAFLIIENADPDWKLANPYVHDYEDASDRLANDPDSPSGVTYDYAFATDITRTAVALTAREAILVPEPVRR